MKCNRLQFCWIFLYFSHSNHFFHLLPLPKRVFHMKSKLIGICILSVLMGVYSCLKNMPANPTPTPPPTPTPTPTPAPAALDTSGPLKSANTFALGFAVQYNQMSGNPTFASVVAREGNWVTFGNELKYGSIVKND